MLASTCAEVCEWLRDIEDTLERMNRGVFRFIVEGLPNWVYRVIFKMLWPVTVRLGRVMALGGLWLAVLLFPLIGTLLLGLPSFSVFTSLIWLGLAVAGSLWGLNHLARKKKAALARIEGNEGLLWWHGNDESQDGSTGRPSEGIAFS